MNRRHILQSAASTAIGAGITGASSTWAVKVYEGAPHGLFVTHKDRLNADLLGFINA